MFRLREKATYRMRFARSQSPARYAFAPSPSPKPNANHVILNGAARYRPLAEITPPFPLGTRRRSAYLAAAASRRIPLRFSPVNTGMRTASIDPVAKFPEIRTYENCEPNAFKMSTSKTHDLNSPGINTCTEIPNRLASHKRSAIGQLLLGVVERQRGSSPRTSTDPGETSTNGMSFRRNTKSSFVALTKSTPPLGS
jgi:hypothetical protein